MLKRTFSGSKISILVILISGIALISCEPPDKRMSQPEETPGAEKVNPEIRKPQGVSILYKGMYSLRGDRTLYNCLAPEAYYVAEESELSELSNALQAAPEGSIKNNRIYIEAEGIISSKQDPKSGKNINVLIIGKIGRIDMQFDCNPPEKAN